MRVVDGHFSRLVELTDFSDWLDYSATVYSFKGDFSATFWTEILNEFFYCNEKSALEYVPIKSKNVSSMSDFYLDSLTAGL